MKRKILCLLLVVILAVSISVPAFAVTPVEVQTDDKITAISADISEGETIPVVADYNNDGTNDFTYAIPGVIETGTYKMASQFDYPMGLAGKDVTVLTIKAGTKISLEGAFGFRFEVLQYKDGLLQSLPLGTITDYDHIIKLDLGPIKQVDAGNGQWYEILTESAYISFVEPGYYAFEIMPFVSELFVTDPKAENFGHEIVENRYRFGGLIIRVVPADAGGPIASDVFTVDSFRSYVESMEFARKHGRLDDSTIRELNRQLIELNSRRELSNEPGIAAALRELNLVLSKVQLNDLAVHRAPSVDYEYMQETDTAVIAGTHVRVSALQRNLDRAMVRYG